MQETAPDSRSICTFGASQLILSVTFFLALVFRVNGLAALSGGVLLLVLGTRLWTRLAARRMHFSVSMNHDRLYPDETLILSVKLENSKLLPLWLRFQLDTPKLLDAGDEALISGETILLPFELKTRQWRLTGCTRGIVSFNQARAKVGDLLGFHQRRLHFPVSEEVIIFPRLGQLMPLHIPFQEFFGIHSSKGPVEDPAWYAGTRDYTGNRPARNIHWKASARLARLQEKLYEPTSHRKVLFVLDTSGYSQPVAGAQDLQGAQDGHEIPDSIDTFEHLISTTATLAHALMETGASFGFITNARLHGARHRELPIGRGPEQLGALLELLARIEAGTEVEIAEVLPAVNRADLGIAYCGYEAGPSAYRLAALGPARRSRLLFIFARPPAWLKRTEGDETKNKTNDKIAPFYWEGFPAWSAGEVVHVE